MILVFLMRVFGVKFSFLFCVCVFGDFCVFLMRVFGVNFHFLLFFYFVCVLRVCVQAMEKLTKSRDEAQKDESGAELEKQVSESLAFVSRFVEVMFLMCLMFYMYLICRLVECLKPIRRK